MALNVHWDLWFTQISRLWTSGVLTTPTCNCFDCMKFEVSISDDWHLPHINGSCLLYAPGFEASRDSMIQHSKTSECQISKGLHLLSVCPSQPMVEIYCGLQGFGSSRLKAIFTSVSPNYQTTKPPTICWHVAKKPTPRICSILWNFKKIAHSCNYASISSDNPTFE
jgi:hypothetical protein